MKKKSKRRVAIYARTSTHQQNPDTQLIPLRNYCRDQGWDFVEFVDAGYSGRIDPEDRPALGKAIAHLCAGTVVELLVFRFDRFTRSLETLITWNRRLKDMGARLWSFMEPVDTHSPHGKIVIAVARATAEYEYEIRSQRIKAGIERARSGGKMLGRPRREDIAPDVVVALHRAGNSLRAISKQLAVSRSVVKRILDAEATCA